MYRFSDNSLQLIHIFAGINHAIIVEPLLFLPFGVHLSMLLVPRLATAIAALYFFRYFLMVSNKL
jgi:hypothetical protein